MGLIVILLGTAGFIYLLSDKGDLSPLKPRGIRNNNPGNIKISDENWLGKIPITLNTDRVFEQFETPEYGIRALYKLVMNKVENQGYDTIRKLISNYAPSAENETETYIQFVTNYANIEDDSFLFPYLYESVVRAIMRFENGGDFYSDELIAEAIALV